MKRYNVLFLCTGNSARSILAEALLKRRGYGKFNAFSAGSNPKGTIHPFTIKLLELNNFNKEDFYSKSWNVFSIQEAQTMDFVITVCDSAAKETCPVWPGQPMTSHWSIENPDQPEKPEEEQWQLFHRTYFELDNRIKIFTSLPFDGPDKRKLQNKLDEISNI